MGGVGLLHHPYGLLGEAQLPVGLAGGGLPDIVSVVGNGGGGLNHHGPAVGGIRGGEAAAHHIGSIGGSGPACKA